MHIVIAAAVLAAAGGAWLRWAVVPVVKAYRLGVSMSRRTSQRDLKLLVRTLGRLAAELDAERH